MYIITQTSLFDNEEIDLSFGVFCKNTDMLSTKL